MGAFLYVIKDITKNIWKCNNYCYIFVKRLIMSEGIKLGTISVKKREFFNGFISILQPVLKIRKREAEIFAELLYQCYLRREIEDSKDMFKLVFGYDTRITIGDQLKISPAVLRNALTYLRKKRLIINNTIPKHYLIKPEEGKEISVTFTFLIQND